MTRRYALILSGAWLAAFGLMHLSTRSVLRVWVDSRKDRWVIPYEGELLLVAGAAFIAAGVIVAAFGLNSREERVPDEGCMRAGMVLLGASALGVCAAGLCQAGLHVARLAIPGGLLHPRSLVAGCAAFALAGAALLVRGAACRGGRPPLS